MLNQLLLTTRRLLILHCIHGLNMNCQHNNRGECQGEPQLVETMCTAVCMAVINRNESEIKLIANNQK
jgi:hypothetical protein